MPSDPLRRAGMEQYVGLDVSQEQTSVCVVDGTGKTLWQGKCASAPEAIAATVRARAPEVARIGLESGPMSAWHWHELKKAGLPVVCLDARHAKAALALQINKSDRNDAPAAWRRSCARAGSARWRSRAWTAIWSAPCSPAGRSWCACASTSPTRSAAC